MSMKLFSTAIAAYRYFSTKTISKSSTKWFATKYKNRTSEWRNPKKPRIKWTDEQAHILAAVSKGRSVFITGSAGTGKTILIQSIIKRLDKIHEKSQVFVTASTGMAACVIRGQTLHSFSGVGLGQADRKTLLSKVLSDKGACRRWNRAKALVIDEISMIDAELFDSLEYIARQVRNEEHQCKDEVWGGLQLVVSGDFFQLPPVITFKKILKRKWKGKEFAFEADCWDSSFDLQVELTKIFRQSDTQLVKLLQGIRRGEIYDEDLQILEKCCPEKEVDSSVVQLYPRNEDVNRVNKMHMEKLGRPVYVYRALDIGEDLWKRQLTYGMASDELMLCEGARVMLIKNKNPWRKLVNGATGTITGFLPDAEVSQMCKECIVPVVKFDSGREVTIRPEIWTVMKGDKIVAMRKQLPLILAWALSVHKCQGMTLNSLHTDLSRAFDFGMVYVALSRVRSLDGLHLSGFDPEKIMAHPKVLEFYQRFSQEKDEQGEGEVSNEDQGSRTKLLSGSKRTAWSHCKPNSSLISWHDKVMQEK